MSYSSPYDPTVIDQDNLFKLLRPIRSDSELAPIPTLKVTKNNNNQNILNFVIADMIAQGFTGKEIIRVKTFSCSIAASGTITGMVTDIFYILPDNSNSFFENDTQNTSASANLGITTNPNIIIDLSKFQSLTNQSLFSCAINGTGLGVQAIRITAEIEILYKNP